MNKSEILSNVSFPLTLKSQLTGLCDFSSLGRNKETNEEEKVLDGLSVTDSPEDLCWWLCTCVNKLRKGDESVYIPRSNCQFISGLQWYVNQKKTCLFGLPTQLIPFLRICTGCLTNGNAICTLKESEQRNARLRLSLALKKRGFGNVECSPLIPCLVYCELCSIIMGLILFSAVVRIIFP